MYEIALSFAMLCFLGVCGYYWRSPAFSMFHPMTFYLAFHGLLFVARPILAWARGYDRIYIIYEFTPSQSDKTTAIVAATIGLLSFAFFCLRSGYAPMRFGEDEAIREERRQLSQVFVWVLAICGPLAIYSLMSSFGEENNYVGLITDRSTGVAINTVRNGYFTDLQLMAVSLTAITVWLARFRMAALLPTAAFVLYRASTGGRGPFVAATVSAGLFYLYSKRIRYPGFRVIAGTLALLAFFSFVGADRGAAIRQVIGLEEKDGMESAQSPDRFIEGMDFANMEYFEYLVYVIPQKSGTYDYFLDNLQVFTEPVPRILWRGKPVGEPFRRVWLFDYGNPVGMTKSVPGEGWYALGWLGVVIWCGLWGHVLGTIYNRFVSGDQTTFKTACYLVFLPILIVALRDGLLLSVFRATGVYLMPIFIWSLVAKFTGIPKAAEIRAAMARNRLAAGSASNGAPDERSGAPDAVRPGATGRSKLPPAVIRRRALLQDDHRSTPAQ